MHKLVHRFPNGTSQVSQCRRRRPCLRPLLLIYRSGLFHNAQTRTQVSQWYGIGHILLQVMALDTLVNNPHR